jgi:acylphosphatase
MIRKTVFLSGQVQGVGMRYRVHQIANGLQLVGTVENLLDGRVKIVVEGVATDLDQLLSKLSESSTGFIKTMEQFESEASGEFLNFSVAQ